MKCYMRQDTQCYIQYCINKAYDIASFALAAGLSIASWKRRAGDNLETARPLNLRVAQMPQPTAHAIVR